MKKTQIAVKKCVSYSKTPELIAYFCPINNNLTKEQ